MEFKLVNWTEAMSVDGGPIDETHQKLISLINRLHLVVNRGADCDSVSNILCELADYAGAGVACRDAPGKPFSPVTPRLALAT